MPRVYMLIGVPGSGKSTWCAGQSLTENFTVVSSDRYIDEEATRQGKTYNDVFADYIKVATKMMENHALVAQANGLDIIWDQTNTSARSRKAKLAPLTNYEKVAVVFKTPEVEELTRRLNSRPGKVIPAHVMEKMIAGLELPTTEEGFTEILYVD
jgi:predicted kinase